MGVYSILIPGNIGYLISLPEASMLYALDLPSKFAEGHSFKFTVNNSKVLEEYGTDTYDVGKYTYFLIEILDINGSVIDSYDSSILINQHGYGITKDKSRLTNIELRNDCFYNNLAIKYND